MLTDTKIISFDHREIRVEIHLNVYRKKYFWVTGERPDRFIGACQYFTTIEEAKADAKREIDLNAH